MKTGSENNKKMSTKVKGFPPIAAKNSEILILGSMPGVESLKQQKYYAHPRNAFWYIMGELYGAVPEIDYPERKKKLLQNKVAVWDVLMVCDRPGSLDSNIDNEIVNDFDEFVGNHRQLRKICFNGQKAAQVFNAHVLQRSRNIYSEIEFVQLPSTSPAMASLSKEDKLKIWKKLNE